MNILITIMATIVASLIFASFFEWTLHRNVMHRPFLGFTYPFKAHALTHHHIFKADQTYHLQDEKDLHTIHMAWWNGPFLISIAAVPPILLGLWFRSWLISIVSISVFCLYYGAYEYLHWCMHLPLSRRRLVEKIWPFKRLNGHHLLHHRYPMRNLNVVLPLADIVFGTILTRSPVKFRQATGPSVPDVQPLS